MIRAADGLRGKDLTLKGADGKDLPIYFLKAEGESRLNKAVYKSSFLFSVISNPGQDRNT